MCPHSMSPPPLPPPCHPVMSISSCATGSSVKFMGQMGASTTQANGDDLVAAVNYTGWDAAMVRVTVVP